ncbi:MAG TPA: hypothetical protein VGG34_12080 [Opitutaceae bacterium]|jgi:predicted LPLAT superfamily acyltransferase
MARQRACSREYLRNVLPTVPRLRDIHRHFFAACDSLMLRLSVANGRRHSCALEEGAGDFSAWLSEGGPVLLGTFHIGNSDLTGYMLAGQEKRKVHLVRMRVGNSHDTEALGLRFGGLLHFVWVNDPQELLFALKEAGSGGDAVAMQCDRAEHSSKTEMFEFLGDRRQFPFTIYYLSLIFGRPVILSFGAPEGRDRSVVHASPAFAPLPGETRRAALERARAHFQAFLARVEKHLRSNPWQWLNFRPL